MRMISMGMALALAGCGSVAIETTGGWTYLEMPGVVPSLQYALKPVGTFAGTCASGPAPTFMIMDGDYGEGIRRFDVTIDGDTRSYEVYNPQKGAALVMLPEGRTGSAEESANQRAQEARLAGARSNIVFTANDGWTRTIPADPAIGKFIARCHQWRKDHPGAE